MRLAGSHPPFVGALIETRRKIKEWSLTTSPDLIDVINCRWSFVEFQGGRTCTRRTTQHENGPLTTDF